MRRYRWGDHDRFWGPLTYDTRSGYEAYGVRLKSGDQDDDEWVPGSWGGPVLALHLGKLAVFLPLPNWVLRPHRRWVEVRVKSYEKPRGYHDTHARELGLVLTRSGAVGELLDTVSLTYGRQTLCSSDTRSKTWFLPFMEHRLVRTTYLKQVGGDLEVYAEVREPRPLLLRTRARLEALREARQGRTDADRDLRAQQPHVAYTLRDYDGTVVSAAVRFTEREWRRGDRWFWWMGALRSLFSPVVVQSLDVDYSVEVGRRKETWKGGTLSVYTPASVVDDPHASALAYFASEGLEVLGVVRFVDVCTRYGRHALGDEPHVPGAGETVRSAVHDTDPDDTHLGGGLD